MRDFVLLSSEAKSARITEHTDAPPASLLTTAEMLPDASARSASAFVPTFAVSPFSSGLPLIPPISSASGWQNFSRRGQRSTTSGNHSSHSGTATTHCSTSFPGWVSASAERRPHYHTSSQPLQPSQTDVAAPRQSAEGVVALRNAQEQLRLEQPVMNPAVAENNAAVTVHPPPPAALSPNNTSPTVEVPTGRGSAFNQPITPLSPLIVVDTTSALKPTNFAVTAKAAAAAISTKSSAISEPHASAIESNWVDYDVYLRLSAPLLLRRSLQERVALLCCASTTIANEQKRLVCLDNVLPFLLHGSTVTPPVVTPKDGSASIYPLSYWASFGASNEAQRTCFPLFCLLGAKRCALAEHSHAIRSIHTPIPPVAVSLAMSPQADKDADAAVASRKSPHAERLCILLLFSEQLLNAYPDFPSELLCTTGPGGAVVSEPPPEAFTYCRSWQETPREARRSAPYDTVWSAITLQRFAVLLGRWGVSPAAALQKLAVSTPTKANEAERSEGLLRPVVPRQLPLSTADSTSDLSIPSQSAKNEDGENGAAVAQRHRGDCVHPVATMNSAHSHLPCSPNPRQQQQKQQPPSMESSTLSTSGTAISSSVWDCTSSSKALVPGQGDCTSATEAAVRHSTPCSRRARHEAVLTSYSCGTLVGLEVMDRPASIPAGEGKSEHPYNAADANAALSLHSNERTHYGHVHKYHVPFPPRPPLAVSPTAGVRNDVSLCLRTFSRRGGVVPTVVANSTSFEAWSSKNGISPAYVPSPPLRHSQRSNSNASVAIFLSTYTGRRHYNDTFTPLPPRPKTADVYRRPTIPVSPKRSAFHPYNVSAAAAAAAAAQSSKRRQKSHKHNGSSTRHRHSKKAEGCTTAAGAPQAASKKVKPEIVCLSTGVNGSEVSSQVADAEKSAENAKQGDHADHRGTTISARKRTEQVNAYMQDLLEVTAARKREEATAASGKKRCRNSTDSTHRGNHTELNGGASSMIATTLEGDLHAHSDRSNVSANANSLNTGRPLKAAEIANAGATLDHWSASAEMGNGTNQRVGGRTQYVPAPPPSPLLSASRRSNPHTCILQNCENSMTSQSNSGWRSAAAIAVDKVVPAEPPTPWSRATAVDAVLPHPPHSMSWEQRQREEMTLVRDGAAFIPSVASSQSQLTVYDLPAYRGTAREQDVTCSSPGDHHEQNSIGVVMGSHGELPVHPNALSFPSTVLSGGTADTDVVSGQHSSTHTASGNLTGALPSEADAVERTQFNGKYFLARPLSMDSPQFPASRNSAYAPLQTMTQPDAAVSTVVCTSASEVMAVSHFQGDGEGATAATTQQSPKVLLTSNVKLSSVVDGKPTTKAGYDTPETDSAVQHSLATPPAHELPLPLATSIVPPIYSPSQQQLQQQQRASVVVHNDGLLSKAAQLQVVGTGVVHEPSDSASPAVVSSALSCTGVAAQLRGLIARILQDVGRGYLARHKLGIETAQHKAHVRVVKSEDDVFLTSDGASRSISAHSPLASPPPAAAAAAVQAQQALFPPAVAAAKAAGNTKNSNNADIVPTTTAAADSPETYFLTRASVTDTRPMHELLPPPLTGFTVPVSQSALRSPVLCSSLPVVNDEKETKENNSASGISTEERTALRDKRSDTEHDLDPFPSSQSSGTPSQHPSTAAQSQRLFAVYSVTGNSVLENSSVSWMPPSLGQGNVAYFTVYNESGALDSRLPQRLRGVEQSLDASRHSSLFLPWAKEGAKGSRDGLSSSHTLPPPREENVTGSNTGGDEEEDDKWGTQQSLRNGGSHAIPSLVAPMRVGRSTVETALPPSSLMKPIVVPSRDRLGEEASSSVLRDSKEDWLNMLQSRLGGSDNCTVVFFGQTANGPTAVSVINSSSAQDPASTQNRPGLARHSYPNFTGTTGRVNLAMIVLQLQRVGRGYLLRQQLSQRLLDIKEEEHLDALLKNVLLCGPSSPSLLRVTAEATAATIVEKPSDNAVMQAEGPKHNGADKSNDVRLLSAAMGLCAGAFPSTLSPVSTASSATLQGVPTTAAAAAPVMTLGRVDMSMNSSDRCPPWTQPPFLGPPLSPFQVLSEGCAVPAPTSAWASVAEGGNDRASLGTASGSVSKLGSGGSGGTAVAAASDAAAMDAGSILAGGQSSPFVTPDSPRYLVPPALLSPQIQPAPQSLSQSFEIAPSNSLSLSKEGFTNVGNGNGMTNIASAFGNALMNNNSAGGGFETPSLPASAARRRGSVSPPSVRVSFSRDSYSSTARLSESEFPAAAAASALGVASIAAAAAEAPVGKSPRIKLVEGINGSFFRRLPPRAGAEMDVDSCSDGNGKDGCGTTAVAAVLAAATHTTAATATTTTPSAAVVAEEPPTENSKNEVDGTAVEKVAEVATTPAGVALRRRAMSAAAGAIISPLEGSIFASSSRNGRSMISMNSLPFEFSTTAHGISSISQGELLFGGHTMESITPAQWALDGVEIIDSSSRFDDGESGSDDNEDSSGSDEEAEEGNNSDDVYSEADAFKKDITHVEEGGADPACFDAAAHLLRGEDALVTKEEALSVLQRVGRGYLCRRHQHFLFMVLISSTEVALLQRVALAYLARRKMGLEYQVNRLVNEEVAHWDLRNRAAIKLHAMVRGFIARQRVKRLQRKLFTRTELRTALELPDLDE